MASAATITTRPAVTRSPPKPFYKVLYVQVLIAIVLGALVGWLLPGLRDQRLDQGAWRRLRQADQDGDRADHLLHRRVGHRAHPGRQEGRPGRRQGADLFRGRLDLRARDRPPRRQLVAARARASAAPRPTPRRSRPTPSRPSAEEAVDFVLHIIPDSVVGAFAQGDILQVLLFSILFGFALMALGERGRPLRASSTTRRTRCSASSPSS